MLVADSLVGIHPHPGPTRRKLEVGWVGRRRRNETRGEEGGGGTGEGSGWDWGWGGPSGVEGVVVGGYLKCEEAECEGDE